MAEVIDVERTAGAARAQPGKYLTFALGPEEYGLEIMKVKEIIGYMNITSVPQTPDYVEGVINLRGRVIPVVNLRTKFNMDKAERTEQTCIIVMEINADNNSINTGIVVDSVSEVLDITAESIEPSPDFGVSVNTDYIFGMGKIGESVKILLDIDKVLGSNEMAQLASQAAEDAATG